MQGIISRLEAAQEGSFLLNKEILRELGYTWRGMAYWHADNKQTWKGSVDFTSSIDAALTLVPDGVDVELDRDNVKPAGKLWFAHLSAGDPVQTGFKPQTGRSDTGALALCIAALKAKSAAHVGSQET